MPPHLRMRQYQQQAVLSASPQQLVAQLYDLGVAACHREDRQQARGVLVQLMSGLDFARGGDLANRLHAIYTYCLNESALGDLETVAELLAGLREAWSEGVLDRPVAA